MEIHRGALSPTSTLTLRPIGLTIPDKYMSRFFLVAACCLILLATPLVAQREGVHSGGKLAKQQVMALEDQWKAATLAGDAAAMDKMLSTDYVGISWTGQVNTKAMQLDRTRNRSLTISQFDVTDRKIKVVGPIAIVTAHVDVDGTNDGANIQGEFLYTRIYQRLPTGTWQITNFEATRVPQAGRPDHPRHPHPPPPATPVP